MRRNALVRGTYIAFMNSSKEIDLKVSASFSLDGHYNECLKVLYVDAYIYIYIYEHYIRKYVYIYIYREREREREIFHMYIWIYTYIYIL